MTDIHVEPELWRDAATSLDWAATDIQTAKDAAVLALEPNAFGLMCSPLLLPIYSLVELAAVACMSQSQQALRNTASNIRTAVSTLETNDTSTGYNFDGLGGGI
ncbi:MAG: hypothetical protein LBR58_01305 [Propionibacteriaceae bacterium]|nr:hypothetical protein [Propionibacteriaceae bacterium]